MTLEIKKNYLDIELKQEVRDYVLSTRLPIHSQIKEITCKQYLKEFGDTLTPLQREIIANEEDLTFITKDYNNNLL